MSEKNSTRRIELIKKRIEQGLTLTEAYELAKLESQDLVPWKFCQQHDIKYLYASKCPNC